jgi:hypothetical protein
MAGFAAMAIQDSRQGNFPPPQKKQLWKTMTIQANASKNQENSGRFIRKYVKFCTILSLQTFKFQL